MQRLPSLRLCAALALLALAITLPSLLGCACGSMPSRFAAALGVGHVWVPASCTGPTIVPTIVPSTTPAHPAAPTTHEGHSPFMRGQTKQAEALNWGDQAHARMATAQMARGRLWSSPKPEPIRAKRYLQAPV